jgi:hypothetical protein
MCIQRVTFTPAMGKGQELRALVEKRVVQGQARGDQVSLAVSVVGEHVPSLVVTRRFTGLAAFEKNRASNRDDKDFQDYVAKVNSMATTKIELLEVVIPFVPR